MPQGSPRLILVPAMLIAACSAAACGASSPTAPVTAAAELNAGTYTLALYGTSTCVSDTGEADVLPAASVVVVIEPGDAPGAWRLSAPGQSLVGEVGFTDAGVEGYVRGSAITANVRVTTGVLPDETVAFGGALEPGRYSGDVIIGTPRFEGLGAASGDVTTCQANGFTLTRS